MATPPGKGSAEIHFMGMLTAEGQKHCTKDWQVQWKDPHYQAGFTRLTGPENGLAALAGKPVLLKGRTDSQFKWPKVTHAGECPQAQMRSDWVWSKSGMRVRTEPRTGIGNFKHTSVRDLTELSADQKDGKVTVHFINPVAETLKDLTMRIHYEGCYGKPGHHSEEKSFATLSGGAKASATFDSIWKRSDGQKWRAIHAGSTIQLFAKNRRVRFDLNVPLRTLGTDISCPKRP